MNKKIILASLLITIFAQSICKNNNSLSIPQNSVLNTVESSIIPEGAVCRVTWQPSRQSQRKYTITCYDGSNVIETFNDVITVKSSLTGTPGWLGKEETYIGTLKIRDAAGTPGAGKRIDFYKR